MHTIYIDEAGTSSGEPNTVVVGICVDADRHERAELALEEAKDRYVPSELRKGFIFHATEIFSGNKNRAAWKNNSRGLLFEEVVKIPRALGLPIAVAKVRRDVEEPTYFSQAKSKPTERHHAVAFTTCLVSADEYLRTVTPEDELAFSVAEDCPGMHHFLVGIPKILSTKPIKLEARDRGSRKGEWTMTLERIVEAVHFASKQDAALLQLADACAFSIRRCLANAKHGNYLTELMLGMPFPIAKWQEPVTSQTFAHLPPIGFGYSELNPGRNI